MLIIALVLALVGLVALVFAVVTSNELVAWVCIAASVLGVVLLIIDAVQERRRRDAGAAKTKTGMAGTARPPTSTTRRKSPMKADRTPKPVLTSPQTDAGTDASEESAVSAEGRRDERK